MNKTTLSATVDSQFDEMRAILEDLVRIPSVSAGGYPVAEVRRSAEHIAELLRKEGASGVRLLELALWAQRGRNGELRPQRPLLLERTGVSRYLQWIDLEDREGLRTTLSAISS